VARTDRATAERLRRAAHRAIDDPVKLARAARIIRAALDRDRITLADLTPLPAPDQGEAA
jgi:hypothetical protein